MSLKKQHDILNLFLLLPARFDALHANFSDSLHLNQGIRIFLDNLQGILPKLFYNPSCKLRTNPFDQSGTQIFFNAIDCRRECLFKLLHRKLPAIFGIYLPESLQRQNRAHMRIRHRPYHSDKIFVVLHGTLQHGIAIFRILICNSFYHTAQILHKFPFLSKHLNLSPLKRRDSCFTDYKFHLSLYFFMQLPFSSDKTAFSISQVLLSSQEFLHTQSHPYSPLLQVLQKPACFCFHFDNTHILSDFYPAVLLVPHL